jgi:hypothetical protein
MPACLAAGRLRAAAGIVRVFSLNPHPERRSVAWRNFGVIRKAPPRARIQEIATRSEADEVMIATHAYDPAARIRSYELVAQAFGLPEFKAGIRENI